jgi:CheY-like chemotaxis protein
VKVLIAEDSPQTIFVLQSVVESLGHECLLAPDGQEAWELFHQHHPTIVISDWLMPRLDGHQLCRLIRESDRPQTHFIFVTSLEDKLHLLEGRRAGADEYLTKPIDVDQLREHLEAATARLAVPEPVDPLEMENRAELIRKLVALGPRLSTTIVVNGRSLSLDAAIKLIEQLPPEATVGRRWPAIWIRPDPWVKPNRDGASRPPSSGVLQRRKAEYQQQAEIVARLKQGVQDEQNDIEDDRRGRWWDRLRGLLGERS